MSVRFVVPPLFTLRHPQPEFLLETENFPAHVAVLTLLSNEGIAQVGRASE